MSRPATWSTGSVFGRALERLFARAPDRRESRLGWTIPHRSPRSGALQRRCSRRRGSMSKLLLAALQATEASVRWPISPAEACPRTCRACFPQTLGAVSISRPSTVPPVFGWLAEAGNVPRDDLLRTFNCGVGMVVVVARIRPPPRSRRSSPRRARHLSAGRTCSRSRDAGVALYRRVAALNQAASADRDPDLRTGIEHGRADRRGARCRASAPRSHWSCPMILRPRVSTRRAQRASQSRRWITASMPREKISSAPWIGCSRSTGSISSASPGFMRLLTPWFVSGGTAG